MDPLTAVLTEAYAFADLLDPLTPGQRRGPTPCADWTINDLARHVANGLFNAAEAFHRARFGTLTPPVDIENDAAPKELVRQIRTGADHLGHALHAGPTDWPDIPLRFGRHPVATALHCLIIEYGVHRNDLARAAGDAGAPFTRATVDALLSFGPQFLLAQAEPVEARALGYTIVTPSTTMSVSWDGRHWQAGIADAVAPRCVITASDDDAARLMLRRLDITDPKLRIEDPSDLAPLFGTAIRPL